MTRFTEKTVRTDGQWLKISRDNTKRTFTFARGYAGQYTANEIEILSFKEIYPQFYLKARHHKSNYLKVYMT